jgi:LysR family transcriptional regulator for metE and metH
MRRAAERLHVSQPALSRRLSAIEGRLGVRLFLRAPRFVPTPAGEELLAAAHVVLERLDAVEHKLVSIGQGNSGVIRLSTECNTCYQWLPARLSSFYQKYPDVSVEIVIEASPNPLPWLMDGRLDLAIVSSDPVLDSYALTPLFKDQMVAVMAPNHALAKKSFLRPIDFAEEHLFVYNSPVESNRIFQRVLTPAGVRPRKVTPMPLTEATLELVKAGLGIAVLARWSVANFVATKSLAALRITESGFWRNWAAVYRRESVPSHLKDFVKLLAAEPCVPIDAAPPRAEAKKRLKKCSGPGPWFQVRRAKLQGSR